MLTAKLTGTRLSAVICLGLTLVTAALYWPMLHHGFINYYDDSTYITDNPHVNAGLTGPGIEWAFRSGYAANWHPLTWISHMLDCQLYGVSPAGHHFTNLLLHIANTLLLFIWLNKITGAQWRSAFVAALFAWHPVHVESVAWAAERKDVLSAFFWMLALIAYTRYAHRVTQTNSATPPVTRHLSLDYFLALFFFACGLMSKPMVVTLPFVLLLLDFWPLERFSRFTFHVPRSKESSILNPQPSTQSVTRMVVEKIPFFALAAAGSIITCSVQHSGGAFWSSNVLPLPLRLENALMAYSRYLSKIFWPVDLALIYPYPHGWPPIVLLSAAVMLLMWSAFFIWRARQNPYLFTGWFWFLGTLVPTIGLVQVGVQSMADRYLYLPGIGLFLVLAWGLKDLADYWPSARKIVVPAGMAALAGCLVVTRIQLSYWQNSLALFLHTVNVTADNYAAYDYLGNIFEKNGRKDKALWLYEESVRVQPDFPMGRFNLGMLLLENGRPAEASNHLALAAQWMPHNPDVQYDFGVFLRQQGNPAEAIGRFKAALGDIPDFPGALNDLAWILATVADAKLRSGAEAVRLAQRACELTQNRQAAMLTTLSAACAEAGRFPDAIATVEKARDLATAAGQTNIAAQDEALLKRYQAGYPCRESY
ncbi:MAG: tetratricopeptide repeat protein [Limisphaerales bacterium]